MSYFLHLLNRTKIFIQKKTTFKIRESSDGRCAIFNNQVKPICLPTRNSDQFKEGHSCYITGWGKTSTTCLFDFYKKVFKYSYILKYYMEFQNKITRIYLRLLSYDCYFSKFFIMTF